MNGSAEQPVALITGGAARIGKAITLALLEQRYRVCVHYNRRAEEASQLISALAHDSTRTLAVQADLTCLSAGKALIARAVGHFGRLDLLVNNAGILVNDSAPLAELARMKLINIDAPHACLDAALPHLTQARGAVVNIADVAGIYPFSKHKAYSRTKAALVALTREKALELAPVGVRVNGICPGTILPPPSYTADRIQKLVEQIPMGRIGSAGDVAQAVLFLAQASYVTGQILFVDGGRHLALDREKRSQAQSK